MLKVTHTCTHTPQGKEQKFTFKARRSYPKAQDLRHRGGQVFLRGILPHLRTHLLNLGLFQPIIWKEGRRMLGHLRTSWCLRQGASKEKKKKMQIPDHDRHSTISQSHQGTSQPWESDLRTAARRYSCSAKLPWFLLKIDFEVVLRSEKASGNPTSLALTSLRQAGYYYYLLFVDGYSKPSVRSSPRPGNRGATALEISCLVPRAAREVRVIKVHFAIAICSVGCLTLHLTAGFCCPCSTGNRKLYKLQRWTPGKGEEELEGRRRMQELVGMGISNPYFAPSLP